MARNLSGPWTLGNDDRLGQTITYKGYNGFYIPDSGSWVEL